MSEELVKAELINIIGELFKDNGYDVEFIEYCNFVDDLGIDSITFITLVVELESHFQIIVPDEKLLMEYFKNINEITEVIVNCLKNK